MPPPPSSSRIYGAFFHSQAKNRSVEIVHEDLMKDSWWLETRSYVIKPKK